MSSSSRLGLKQTLPKVFFFFFSVMVFGAERLTGREGCGREVSIKTGGLSTFRAPGEISLRGKKQD